jgi:hypothetical protein
MSSKLSCNKKKLKGHKNKIKSAIEQQAKALTNVAIVTLKKTSILEGNMH